VAESGNLKKLREALQAEFDRNPVRFFRTFVLPLASKHILAAVFEDGPPPASVEIRMVHTKEQICTSRRRGRLCLPMADTAGAVAGSASIGS
jgi:hypothetical protein